MIRQETFEKIFREHLKVETYSKSIDSLFSPRLKNKIDYKPYYQRNYVWDYNKATYFLESILLGTEIPPLIFFDNNSGIEIIDGRQRFETIMRFMENKFPLKPKGLQVLGQLKNKYFDDLAKDDREIIEKFLDAKLRIIEFKLVNDPPLDKYLEDRVKKEIFSRYNSGITPLKKSEIDNAVYDEDSLSSAFKEFLESNEELLDELFYTFFKTNDGESKEKPLEKIMTFIRKSLVLPMTPIAYYARGTNRTDLLTKLYEKISDDSVDDEKQVIESFKRKLDFISSVRRYAAKAGLKTNRLALECFLWALGVLELEDIVLDFADSKLIEEIGEFIDANIEKYSDQDYGFNKQVITRYLTTCRFIEQKYKIDTSVYISPDELKRLEIKELIKPNDTNTKLSELESLRLNKPEPSRISIDDVVRLMNKRRFLVRPSYQRKEVINPKKASAIIESILLGIALPAIFIYKREDNVSEVIDGQQRLLTLLGFIGSEYVDEKGKSQNSKNHKFSLRKMKILKELDGRSFDKLDEEFKNKIYDFPLYLVEIDQVRNAEFDPIDLFIRLNDKPFPIRENSFEMWNSWVDVDFINNIKSLKSSTESWFFVKQLKTTNDRDRMENEELLTSLIFLEYNSLYNSRKSLDIYQKEDRLNARISDKVLITNLLIDLTENKEDKSEHFETAIKNIKSFIKKLKYVLLDKDKPRDEVFDYLKHELDEIFKAGKDPRYFRRTLQDFYFIWLMISEINFEMIKYHRLQIKERVKLLFMYLKNIPLADSQNNKGLHEFLRTLNELKEEYKMIERKILLTEEHKLNLIKQQQGMSAISNAPIFLGDDIEVDHEIPISKGGKDEIENLNIVHKDENRKKGASL
ncbi:hypothetical protein A4D02_35740 [Niastella koreensis]|uniref:HNH nuclease domain-containing protein n=2 Tax=Niastella koreensis TaxID=354356 RepID=G8THM7_NIAKG|nr:DUF262 domain-containing protein [Niastella koreensis]AEV97455.1 protein of unknown function DUF262 [Niastella koreensis GR20-10]OQP44162.1 hypothetical protein A4D02_35740 [Niastella koreensis]